MPQDGNERTNRVHRPRDKHILKRSRHVVARSDVSLLFTAIYFHELPMTGPMRGPLGIVPCPRLFTISFRLSSHVLSALRSCITLSRLPCRTSLILTDPIFTLFSRRKSNNRNRPSSCHRWVQKGTPSQGSGARQTCPSFFP